MKHSETHLNKMVVLMIENVDIRLVNRGVYHEIRIRCSRQHI